MIPVATEGERLASLETWRSSHDRACEQRYGELREDLGEVKESNELIHTRINTLRKDMHMLVERLSRAVIALLLSFIFLLLSLCGFLAAKALGWL